ncbi:MAG: hypothetical protein NC200_03600 [Candidatus Gastranaerophilales bacterium]|nr:hypothetical protein [Candidatus Gastranaerophilales bacterium]
MNINNDLESQRIRRNLTKTQIKAADSVKEGVLVNSNVPLSESYNSLLIADSVELPNKLYEKNTKKEKGLFPIAAATVGFMGVLAGVTGLFAKSAKNAVDIDLAKKLPSITRNVCVNKEIDQAIYRVVANPTKKTLMAAAGLAVFSSMAFMGKTFCEGFRDVWVKKKEADIHKDLQENLIAVETQSFSGKMQIIRNMLSEKAKEFNGALIVDSNSSKSSFSSHSISFCNKSYQLGEKQESNLDIKLDDKLHNKSNKSSGFWKNSAYMALGAISTAAIIGFGYLSMKNLRSCDASMKRGVEKVKNVITEIAENTHNHNVEQIGKENYDLAHKIDREKITNLFVDISADTQFVTETAEKMKWETPEEKQVFIKDSLFNINKSTEKANSALGGSGQDRNSFYSHVSDYKAFFYNWLIDSKNEQFKNLFIGITGATATAYLGELTVNAVKDVQVKKYNAETELNLQKRLVATELRNFKSKKDASINPLCDEFYRQKKNGKSKDELKIVADSILNEIKNGAPYVYS